MGELFLHKVAHVMLVFGTSIIHICNAVNTMARGSHGLMNYYYYNHH